MKKSNIEPEVLFEDNHIIILNKHASEIVQGDKTGDEPLSETVKQYLKTKYHKPGEVFLGVVHRLDRPVSGALIFARTSKALSRLNAMLRDGQIHKKYWAIVKNPPPKPSDRLSGYIFRNERKNKSFVYEKPIPGSQNAELTYEIIDSIDRFTLVQIDLLTGRHHQIRAQLASIGCPVKGDLKYGYSRSNPGGFIHLHARELQLCHPVRKVPLTIIAPLPKERLWDLFDVRQPVQTLHP